MPGSTTASTGIGIQESRIKAGTKLISISSVDLNTKANYQDFQRFQVVDVSHGGGRRGDAAGADRSGEGGDPGERKAAIEKRGEAIAQGQAGRCASGCWRPPRSAGMRARSAPRGWRMEVWAQIKDLDWSLVGSDRQMSNWPSALWPMEKHYHYLGHSGGFGVGYSAVGVGRRRARQPRRGRFSVRSQPDGDLMYTPGVLWTAAHHQIPMLTVMHNNRGYHQEVMHVQRLSNCRNRVASLGETMGPIGTSIEAPRHRLRQDGGVDGLVGRGSDQGSGGARARRSSARSRRSSPASRRWSTSGRSRAEERGHA